MPVSTSPPINFGIDPRIRQRRIEVLRAQGRRRLRALSAAGVTMVLGITAYAALGSPLLDVDTVTVIGAEHTLPQAVVDAAGIGAGEAMIDVDASGAAARVRELVWVQQATVRREWPGTVTITVTERRPSAVTRTNAVDGVQATQAGSWAVVDIDGRVLEVVAERPEGLVELEGVLGATPETVQPGAQAAAVAGPLEVMRALPPTLAARTAAVVVVHSGEIALKLNPRGTVRFGTADQVAAKVRAIETVLASLAVDNLAVLDVRLPTSPVLTRG